MKVITIEDAKCLIPNIQHKNFTTNNEIIKKGKELEGNQKKIFGLRRGKPFCFRIFITNDKKIIYLNKIKPMATEVSLGADAQTTPTNVNLLPEEKADNNVFMYTIIGGIAGFLFAKYTKKDMKRSAFYIGVGAIAGYGISKFLNRKRDKIFVKPSK